MATITSNQTGDWASTNTWVGGSVPAANDLVVIAHGHKVTLSTNIQSAPTSNVTIDGNLHFANGGKMHLHGRMTVQNSSNNNDTAGEFVEGSTSSGSLLSMVGGSEIKISGSNSDQHGIQANSRKWCGVDIQGSEPTLITQLNGEHTYNVNFLTVDSAANFAAGDLISVYEREIDYRREADECFRVVDVDTSNNRIYFRKFISPEATISAVNGSTITVDDARVFRVGYALVFGTGVNRNVLKISSINANVITLASAVTGSVVGEKVYQTGTIVHHKDDAFVRRTATTNTVAIVGSDAQRVIAVANVSDFNVGDEIVLDAISDTNHQYVSGSETNLWRHNLLYTISSISGNNITVDRDIVYDSIVGCYVIRMTRDIVIKACDSSGNDIAIGDQDTARVFFNVKYWTSNAWNNAPTRRVKVKYVRFKDLGYNTGDTTNFRAGVNIAGYNGRFREDLDGSSHTQSTIHSSSGNSQTGENYVDGCAVTAYALCSNPTRDGDSYPSLCIRHPYGNVDRNNVIVGSGRGYWRWSSGYYIKSYGTIAMVANYIAISHEAMYDTNCSAKYLTSRAGEDYGVAFNNVRQNQAHYGFGYFDIQNQNYALRIINTNFNQVFERVYANRYRTLAYTDTSNSGITILDSQFFPNLWDASRKIYGDGSNGLWSNDYMMRIFGSSWNDFDRTFGPAGKVNVVNHRFGKDGPVMVKSEMVLVKESSDTWRFIGPYDNQSGGVGVTDTIFVPAGAVVKIKGKIKIPTSRLNGSATTVNDGDYPRIEARHGWYGFDGRYQSNYQSYYKSSTDNTGVNGFREQVQFDSSSIGAWQEKELTVAAQDYDYYLSYGVIMRDNDLVNETFHIQPLDVIVSKASQYLIIDKSPGLSISKVRVASDFNINKKRLLGGRI